MTVRTTILACASMLCAMAGSRSPDALRTRHGFVWNADRSSTFEYFFEPSSSAERDIEKIKTLVEQARAHALRLLGETAGPRGVSVFIVETRDRMKELTGTPQNAWSTPQVISFVYGDQVKAVGAHEDCHVLARHFWGNPHADWLDEGLAVYSDDQWWGHPLHAVAKLLDERRKLIPIAAFLNSGWRKNSDLVTYPETGSFVKFLYEKYGLNTVKEAWKGGAGQIPRIFGKKLDDLEREWHATIAAADPTGINYDVP
jgi:hypothetical protein